MVIPPRYMQQATGRRLRGRVEGHLPMQGRSSLGETARSYCLRRIAPANSSTSALFVALAEILHTELGAAGVAQL